MATSLGLGILAEGVEEEHELAALQTQGCHVFQGFLFSRPMAPEEVAAATVFLASPRSAFTTGINMLVDGAISTRVNY